MGKAYFPIFSFKSPTWWATLKSLLLVFHWSQHNNTTSAGHEGGRPLFNNPVITGLTKIYDS